MAVDLMAQGLAGTGACWDGLVAQGLVWITGWWLGLDCLFGVGVGVKAAA